MLMAQMRYLTTIGRAGNVWEGTVYGPDGSVAALVFGSEEFVRKELALAAFNLRCARRTASGSGEFDLLAAGLNDDSSA
jgi:hypothetical protein